MTWPEALILIAGVLLVIGLALTVGVWLAERSHGADECVPDTGWVTDLAAEARAEEMRVDRAMGVPEPGEERGDDASE